MVSGDTVGTSVHLRLTGAINGLCNRTCNGPGCVTDYRNGHRTFNIRTFNIRTVILLETERMGRLTLSCIYTVHRLTVPSSLYLAPVAASPCTYTQAESLHHHPRHHESLRPSVPTSIELRRSRRAATSPRRTNPLTTATSES